MTAARDDTLPVGPAPVDEIPHVWIPLRTGERLAAKIWLPAGATAAPVPALVEYIPYRRRDYSAVRDQGTHAWLAAHGYACLRIDARGSGDSDGIHHEQWSTDYDRDALDAFEWIAAQPWCDGGIGMFGLSWGGQTCLKMASLAPPQLKAVIPCSASDDRYTNKYLGGCLLLNSVVWSATMTAQNSRPPDPATAGDGWRDMWMNRLASTVWYLDNWLAHQRRDEYWQSGSVVQSYKDFGCPVYMFGGLADPGYADTAPRLLKHIEQPMRVTLGPWSHKYPHFPAPGPGMGFLQEARRWFDRWLKGIDNGIETEPTFRAWLHDYAPPLGAPSDRPGRWIEEPGWPSAGVVRRTLWLNNDGLDDRATAGSPLAIQTPQSVGLCAGEWMPWIVLGTEAELPLDQRGDDARCACFDCAPLAAGIDLLGNAEATLELSADAPVACVVVRLCDVAPDGTSMRVAYGALNLTRRDGLEAPLALKPGQRHRVKVPLYVAAHRFPPGHRLRVAVSTTYWPVIWPGPHRATVTLYRGASRIDLPVREPRPSDADCAPFEPIEHAPLMERETLSPSATAREATHDASTGEAVLHHLDDSGTYRIVAHDIEVGMRTERWLRIRDDDPLSANCDVRWTWRLGRGDWRIRTEVAAATWCTADSFETENRIEAFEGETLVFERTTRNSFPRDLM